MLILGLIHSRHNTAQCNHKHVLIQEHVFILITSVSTLVRTAFPHCSIDLHALSANATVPACVDNCHYSNTYHDPKQAWERDLSNVAPEKLAHLSILCVHKLKLTLHINCWLNVNKIIQPPTIIFPLDIQAKMHSSILQAIQQL